MERSETIGKLAAALLKAQIEIKFAKKDSNNPYFKSTYSDLSAVIDAVKEPLNRNGIVYLQFVLLEGVQTVLLHESGEFMSGITPIAVAKTNDAQAQGSAITYAKRYALQAALGVPSEDDDGEGAVGRGTKKVKDGVGTGVQTTTTTTTTAKQFKPATQPSTHGF